MKNKKKKWLSNIKNEYESNKYGMTELRYWQWRKQFDEGEPVATDAHSVAELKAMGMIGLYSKSK